MAKKNSSIVSSVKNISCKTISVINSAINSCKQVFSRVFASTFQEFPCEFSYNLYPLPLDYITEQKADCSREIERLQKKIIWLSGIQSRLTLSETQRRIDDKVNKFIALNKANGFDIDRQAAFKALNIIQSNQSVRLDNTKKRVIVSNKNENGLSDTDNRFLEIFQTIGPVNISELPDDIRNSLSTNDKTRFGTIARHIRVLQGKDSANSIIASIFARQGNKNLKPEMADDFNVDASTKSLAKRAIKIFNLM